MQDAVKHAILVMHARYPEKVTLRDLASEALFSPFHFARMFRQKIGVPPGRYLTAIRLFEAKRLLLTTSLNVCDIVTSVGYSSVGTFTTRFTRMVGISPTQYRNPEVRDLLVAVSPNFQCLPRLDVAQAAKELQQPVYAVTGDIVVVMTVPPDAAPVNVLVGAFDSVVPQGQPAACRLLTGVRSTEFVMRGVPVGRWVVIAIAQQAAHTAEPNALLVGGFGQPVTVSPGRMTRVEVRLRAPQPTDPPIAVVVASPRSLVTHAVR